MVKRRSSKRRLKKVKTLKRRIHRRRGGKRMRGGNGWDDFKKGFGDGFGFVMDTASKALPLLSAVL